MNAQCDPKDKTFLITGGASGLGALYAERFLIEGAKNIAILDVAVEKGRELAAKLNTNYPDQVTFYECDVSDETQLSDVFNQVVTKFGKVDVIINNAGIMVDTPSMWRHACNVNWQGLVSLTLKGVKHMRKDEGGAGGTIINISSTLSIVKIPYLPIYSGSKAAVLHFSRTLAMDPFYGDTGVRLLVLSLDATKTALIKGLQDRAREKKIGELMVEFSKSTIQQKPECAVDVVVKMFKEGAHGSIWLSSNNNPGKDITQTLDEAYKMFEALF